MSKDLKSIKVKQNDKIHFTTIDNEMGFMNVDKGKYYSANEVGSRIWEIVEEPKSIEEIVTILLSEYEIDENTCLEQVTDFVNSMIKNDLIIAS